MIRLKKLIPVFGILFCLLFFVTEGQSQTIRSHVSAGNRAYGKGNYNDAEVAYKKGLLEDPKSREAQSNLGNAYYKQQRFEEAGRQFGNSAVVMTEATDRARSLYNIGNSLFKGDKLQESVEAYKQSLKLNPNDEDARYNLEMARRKLKQQEQQKKQQKQDKKQDQQENKQQQNQDQNKQQQEKQKQEQQNQQNQKQEAQQDQTRQQAQKKNQMPKQEAERILEALRNNEKEIQKNLRKREAVRIKVEKDW